MTKLFIPLYFNRIWISYCSIIRYGKTVVVSYSLSFKNQCLYIAHTGLRSARSRNQVTEKAQVLYAYVLELSQSLLRGRCTRALPSRAYVDRRYVVPRFDGIFPFGDKIVQYGVESGPCPACDV